MQVGESTERQGQLGVTLGAAYHRAAEAQSGEVTCLGSHSSETEPGLEPKTARP